MLKDATLHHSLVGFKPVTSKSQVLHSTNLAMVLPFNCFFFLDGDVGGSSKERPKLVDPNMFSPFLQLAQNKNTCVKLGKL